MRDTYMNTKQRIAFGASVLFLIGIVGSKHLPQKPVILPTPTPVVSQSVVSGAKKTIMVAPVLAQDVFTEVNKFRSSQALAPFAMSKRTCNFAYVRAQEISKDFSHKGFYTRSSKASMPYAGFATENLAQQNTPSYNVVVAWENSPLHRANIVSNTPEVCIMKYTTPLGIVFYAMEGLRAN